MSVAVIIAIIALIIIALVHFYWVFGGTIGLDKALPVRDGQLLFSPGKFLTFLVGLVLLWFAFIAYLLQFDTYSSYITYIGWALSVIFMLRTIGDFNVVGMFKKVKDTEFARYDTKYYVPLCLFLSIVFALIS